MCRDPHSQSNSIFPARRSSAFGRPRSLTVAPVLGQRNNVTGGREEKTFSVMGKCYFGRAFPANGGKSSSRSIWTKIGRCFGSSARPATRLRWLRALASSYSSLGEPGSFGADGGHAKLPIDGH